MGYNNIMYYYAIMRLCAILPKTDGIFQGANAFFFPVLRSIIPQMYALVKGKGHF